MAVNPTDFATTFPHGGSAIGEIRDGVVLISEQRARITSEEYVGQLADEISAGWSVVMTAVLREWDSDGLDAVFPNVETGSSSGLPLVRLRSFGGTGVVPHGSLVSDRAISIVYSPDDVSQSRSIMNGQVLKQSNVTDSSRAIHNPSKSHRHPKLGPK